MDNGSSNENQLGKEYYFKLFQEYFFFFFQILYFPSKGTFTSPSFLINEDVFFKQWITHIWGAKWRRDSKTHWDFLYIHVFDALGVTAKKRKVGFSLFSDSFILSSYFWSQCTSGKISTKAQKQTALLSVLDLTWSSQVWRTEHHIQPLEEADGVCSLSPYAKPCCISPTTQLRWQKTSISFERDEGNEWHGLRAS